MTLAIVLAGCATSSPDTGTQPADAHSSKPSASLPASSPPYDGPVLPNGQCPFLTATQIQIAIGQAVHQVKGCAYSFASGAGTAGVLTTTYSTPAEARNCLAIADRGLKVTKLPGLGSLAQVSVEPLGVTSTLVIRGAKRLVIDIIWPSAAVHPNVAVTLLRDAITNFDRYSAPLTLGCA
jgi:hypothetical protein